MTDKMQDFFDKETNTPKRLEEFAEEVKQFIIDDVKHACRYNPILTVIEDRYLNIIGSLND